MRNEVKKEGEKVNSDNQLPVLQIGGAGGLNVCKNPVFQHNYR